jgi:hypothetical protein
MTFYKTTAALAAILTTTVSGAALAQSADADASVGAEASVSAGDNGANGQDTAAEATTDSETGMYSEVATDKDEDGLTFGRIVSEMNTDNFSNFDWSEVDSETEIDVTGVTEVKGNAAENAEALDQAVAKTGEDIEEFQADVEANAEVNETVQDEGFEAGDVLYVFMTSEGIVQVVVDDRT